MSVSNKTSVVMSSSAVITSITVIILNLNSIFICYLSSAELMLRSSLFFIMLTAEISI